MTRIDARASFWKERFLYGLPRAFNEKVQESLREKNNGTIPYDELTYGDLVRAPPPGPLRRGVVPLTGYRGMSHALFFRLRESSNPRPKGHIEMGSTLTTNWATSSVGSESAPHLTTNWATSSVGSESAPHFNMSLWSWVRALTEAKEKGMGHAL